MTIDHPGGPAFPIVEMGEGGKTSFVQEGMSLRDWFAGQALSAMNPQPQHARTTAAYAYEIADAMLYARLLGRDDSDA